MHGIIRSVTSIPRRRPNDITTGARRHVVALGEPVEVRPLTHVFFQGDEGVLLRTVTFIEQNVAVIRPNSVLKGVYNRYGTQLVSIALERGCGP